jgi:hypothetical protein
LLGVIQMSLTDYSNLTFRQYVNIMTAYNRQQEQEVRNTWELGRWQVWHLINIQLSKQSKMKKMTDLQKFFWDESDEVKTVNTTYTARELEVLKKWG